MLYWIDELPKNPYPNKGYTAVQYMAFNDAVTQCTAHPISDEDLDQIADQWLHTDDDNMIPEKSFSQFIKDEETKHKAIP